jgi:sugar phosphate isomerase/epimerase
LATILAPFLGGVAMREWPVGLSTGCFFDRPFAECLPAIRDAGFSRLEICSFPAHLDYRDRAAVAAASAQLRNSGLDAYSFHAPFSDDIDITALDAACRQRAVSEIGRAVEAAAMLGAQHFVLHPGPENGGGEREERLSRMENAAAALDDIARRCAELGVRLVLENMLPHLFSGHVRDLLWLLGAMHTREVGICLDTGHAFLSGDLHHVAHKLSGHLWMLHASDNRGSFDDHLPPGEGDIPWRDLFDQLARTGFAGTLILEIAGQADRQELLRGADRARGFLRQLAAASG